MKAHAFGFCLILLPAVLALGQNWTIEQIDSTAASQSPVELVKAADGKLWAGYQTASGVVRVACLGDSGWGMTDVRSAYVPGNALRPFLAAGPHGELCLSCYSPSRDSGWLCRLVGDTWHSEPYPFMGQSVVGAVAYDTAGRLHTAFSPDVSEFWAGYETDSGWTAGPEVTLQLFGAYYWNVARFTVARDGPWDFAYVYWEFYSAWGDEMALMHFSGDSWARVWGEAGVGEPMPLALVPHGDGVGSLALRHDTMMCDSEPIVAGISSPVAGLTYSAEDVPLVAWCSGGPPVFAFKTNRWHTEIVPGPTGGGGLDIEVDTSGQVVIVYSTQDSGLWCARGTDVVAVKETKPRAPGPKLAATVLSGASGVRRLASCVVFDAMGRRVTNPRSGILFVLQASSVMRGASSVTKVVISR